MHLSNSSQSALITFIACAAMASVVIKRDRKRAFDSWNYEEWYMVAVTTMGILFLNWTVDVVIGFKRLLVFMVLHR